MKKTVWTILVSFILLSACGSEDKEEEEHKVQYPKLEISASEISVEEGSISTPIEILNGSGDYSLVNYHFPKSAAVMTQDNKLLVVGVKEGSERVQVRDNKSRQYSSQIEIKVIASKKPTVHQKDIRLATVALNDSRIIFKPAYESIDKYIYTEGSENINLAKGQDGNLICNPINYNNGERPEFVIITDTAGRLYTVYEIGVSLDYGISLSHINPSLTLEDSPYSVPIHSGDGDYIITSSDETVVEILEPIEDIELSDLGDKYWRYVNPKQFKMKFHKLGKAYIVMRNKNNTCSISYLITIKQ